VKTFGIYLLFPPKVELHAQGLGRHLAEFLTAAKLRSDARFVIACPSWMRTPLRELFERLDIPPATFEIIGPKDRPLLLKLFDAYQMYLRRPRLLLLRKLMLSSRSLIGQFAVQIERTLATTRNPVTLTLLALLLFPLIIIGYLAILIGQSVASLIAVSRLRLVWFRKRDDLLTFLGRMTARPQSSQITIRLYRFMEEAEAKLVNDHINSRKDIKAWYSPTAFWPQFNKIDAPRLTCVPDVVLSEFPVAFSSIKEERFFETFEAVEEAIKGGDHFVTYSSTVKNRTLIERYQVAPDAITVVPHGASRLGHLVEVSGFADNTKATDVFCASLFRRAIQKAIGTANVDRFEGGTAKFIFYASQFRPNKNILTLLRAYDHLLKNRYVGHKLVLTGDHSSMPEVPEYIRAHNLQNDVLCLHNLSDRELAACYRLADLAVNPSLSEGGCPFTLTEALSVGTPVVMARMAVTEEIITDPVVQDLMLFDPYKWTDMAERIEWALANRDALLERQLTLYQTLAKRSWSDVIDDYISLLDRISDCSPASPPLGDGARPVPTR
jgi:glycosyltransferase involved in cell wall biosynthesis